MVSKKKVSVKNISMRTLLIMIGFNMISNLAFSQIKLTANEIATYQDSVMQKELHLKETLIEPLKKINLKYAEKQKALMDKKGSMFGKIGDMRNLKKSKNTELKAILTKAQFEKYEDDVEPVIRKYMRKQMQ